MITISINEMELSNKEHVIIITSLESELKSLNKRIKKVMELEHYYTSKGNFEKYKTDLYYWLSEYKETAMLYTRITAGWRKN